MSLNNCRWTGCDAKPDEKAQYPPLEKHGIKFCLLHLIEVADRSLTGLDIPVDLIVDYKNPTFVAKIEGIDFNAR